MLKAFEPLYAVFYDKNMKYVSLSAIQKETIKEDYLSIEQSSFTLLSNKQIGEAVFVEIKPMYEAGDSFVGKIKSVCKKNGITQVDCVPVQSIFDTEFYCAFGAPANAFSTTIGNSAISQLMHAMLAVLKLDSAYYNYGGDTSYRYFPARVIADKKSGGDVDNSLYLKELGLNNVFDAITELFKLYSVVVKAYVTVEEVDYRVLNFKISIQKTVEGKHLQTIDATLGNVLEFEVTDDAKNAVNMLTIFNKSTFPNGRALKTYVRTDVGIVTELDLNKYANMRTVVAKAAEAEDADFQSGEIENIAKKELDIAQFKSEIQITYKYGDNLVNQNSIDIGTRATIRTETDEYYSVLSGYEINGGKVKYIFGYGRNKLKQMLSQQRMSNK